MNFNFVQGGGGGGEPRHSRIDNHKLTVTLQFLARKEWGKGIVLNPFGQDCTLVKVPVPGIVSVEFRIQDCLR